MPVDKHRAEFMVNVAHDLKTPLNAVIGFTSVLLQDHELNSEKLHQLQLVYKSARLLLSRIDALCNFYRMQAGVATPPAEWIETGQLLRQLADSFTEAAEQKGLQLTVRAPAGPARMRVSQKLIMTALQELMSNAVKYTSSGTIVLEDSGVRGAGWTVTMSVTDRGPGLTPEALETLRSSLAGDSWAGLGLGLALARQAAALLGGRIEVGNAEKAGCKFSLVVEISLENVEG